MPHHTIDKGDLAVAKVIAHLMEHNIRICRPLSEHLPFDFIAVMPDMHTLRRVQVKYRADNGYGAIDVSFRSNYYDSKRIYSKQVNFDHMDTYAVYCPQTDECYYLRVEEIPRGSRAKTLRLQPSRNKQSKGVWLASNFVDPHRIAQCKVYSLPTRRDVSPKDEFALAIITQDLMLQGYSVCASASQYLPFDLVAVLPDMRTMYRIRTGCGGVERCDVADAYALYNEDTGYIHYLAAREIQEHDKYVALYTHLHVKSELSM